MGRIAEFDGLRGIACVLIMLAHLGWVQDTRWLVSMVDMFFVLSGFLITQNILKKREAENFLPVFFARRSLRIWPAYYFGLVACLILNHYLRWDHRPDAWPLYVTFTQGIHHYWKGPEWQFSGMFKHTWTLAMEEQFYILWPLLLVKAGRRTLPLVLLGFALVPALMRWQGYEPFVLLTRCDGLAIGSIVAWLMADESRVDRHRNRFRAGFAAVAVLALAVPPVTQLVLGSGAAGPIWDRAATSLFTTRACLVYAGFAGVILCATNHPALGLLRDRRLTYFGTSSYGLYLYHPLIFASMPRLYQRFVERKMGLNVPGLRGVAMLALCVVVAELSRRVVEQPALMLKDRLVFRMPARSAAAAPAVYRGPHSLPPATRVDDPAGGPEGIEIGQDQR
ncbi:MAG: acyltransferase [Isosphaeraceae bacterium]